MIHHFIRFCRSRNKLTLVLLVASIYIALTVEPPLLVAIGFLIGTIAYRFQESYFHEQMHKDNTNPFYTTHKLHHAYATPESGCPMYWMFLFYFFVTLTIYLLDRPIVAGIWLGVTHSLFWYEWIHFLCHCDYVPLTKYGTRIRQNHLSHHYENQHARYEMLYPRKS